MKGWYAEVEGHHLIIPSFAENTHVLRPYLDVCNHFPCIYKVIEVIPETVGQSTGKIDIAKTEVYAGDSVKGDVEYGVGHYEEFSGEVYWDEEATFYRVDKVRRIPIYQISNIEVIGTIHDHLLKGDQK